MEMGGMTAEQVDAIVEQAELRAEEAEQQADEQKRLKKELERQGGSAAPAARAVSEPVLSPESSTVVEQAEMPATSPITQEEATETSDATDQN
jgi:N utilization substance protein A